MEALFSQLRRYSESTYYPYHMPGHKRRAFGALPHELAALDITEIDGFDNLHQPEELFAALQRDAARLYGAEESFYLINGSTGGILSAVSAALPEGGRLLMARNCHRAAYHAAYLRRLKISYLYPPILERYDLCDAVTPKQVRGALEREPEIGAVLVVSPTYEGRIADIRAIAEIVHKKGIPLIVDEAHGAHLGLARGFAENSCQAGADLVIHSVHKTLPAMTQTALLHVNGTLVDRDRLRRFLRIYQSSSPSYVLMASIENAVRVINTEKEELFARFESRYREMMRGLRGCRRLSFLPPEPKQDIGKLVICAIGSGLTGRQVYDILRQEYRLQPEMASWAYCLAMFTVGDSQEAYDRMTDALLALDRRLLAGEWEPQAPEKGAVDRKTACGEGAALVTRFFQDEGQEAIPLADAWDSETEQVPLRDAPGRFAGEFVNLYPPGIPLLVPGERITRTQCTQIAEYIAQGLNVQGIVEPSERRPELSLRVIKQDSDVTHIAETRWR